MIRGTFTMLSAFGRLLVPLGVFAVLAVGLHAGADRLDDALLVALGALDTQVDFYGAKFLRWLFTALEVGQVSRDRWVLGFVDAIGLETLESMARILALGMELFADLVFGLALVVPRRGTRPVKDVLRSMVKEPTLFRWAAPLTAALASLAGVLTIATHLQVLTYALVQDLSQLPRLAELSASILGGLVLVLTLWRLVVQAGLGAVHWADRVAARDETREVPMLRRRLRGWLITLVVFPVTVLAVFDAVPLLPTLRALLVVN